jgi:iron complex transport system substrate-binding protein
MPSITETLYALGLSEEVVGVTQNCNYPPEAKLKEKIGRETVNLEKVISLKPDLILMLEDAQKKDIEKLKRFGLPIFTVNPHTVAEVLDSIAEIGRVTGATIEARRLVAGMKKRIDHVKEPRSLFDLWRPKPLVFMVVGWEPLISAGPGTFINDVIRLAGGKNLAGKAGSPYPQYDFEELLNRDPPYIIIPEGLISMDEVKKSDRWRQLSAVKNGRILFVDPDILFRPGPRVVLAIEVIAEFLK